MNIKKRVHGFQDLLTKLSDYEALESQFMISMVEDFDVTIGELPDDGCDYTDQTTRDTWMMIHGECRKLLDAFTPKSPKDRKALRAILKESSAISTLLDAEFQKHLAKESA